MMTNNIIIGGIITVLTIAAFCVYRAVDAHRAMKAQEEKWNATIRQINNNTLYRTNAGRPVLTKEESQELFGC